MSREDRREMSRRKGGGGGGGAGARERNLRIRILTKIMAIFVLILWINVLCPFYKQVYFYLSKFHDLRN